MIRLIEDTIDKHIAPGEIDEFIEKRGSVIASVFSGAYGLQEFLGWFEPRSSAPDSLLDAVETLARDIRNKADTFVLAGVGGSNRAAQSLIEGLVPRGKTMRIVYAGDTLSALAMRDTLDALEHHSVYVNVIAKNFETIEPGIAFRMLRAYLKDRYGVSYNERVLVTGSRGAGQLFDIAQKHGYAFLDFPQNIGGRFSAFCAVGLLPMAVMGVDIRAFVNGARDCEAWLKKSAPKDNSAVRYAAARYLLCAKGFCVENFAYFEPRLEKLAKWQLQLHSETEGKNQRAVLPTLTCFSEDLHAIGQYIQEGGRFLFETFLNMFCKTDLHITPSDFDDGFSYLDAKEYDALGKSVFAATKAAHYEGGIPVLEIAADGYSEKTFGEFMYWNMFSSYLSAALLGVEPFDQNGVENYKRNLRYALRGN